MSEEEIKFRTPPLDPLHRKLWEIGLKNLVDYMYQDIPQIKPEHSLFSGMCAEEIQEVADKLHGEDKYSKNEKMLLVLIANLAARLKENE